MLFRILPNKPSFRLCYSNKIKFFSRNAITENSKLKKDKVDEVNDAGKLSTTWSPKQMPKSLALQGVRFETVDIKKQPNPAAAIELIAEVPVIHVHQNIVACDGSGGKLGHPKIFINLVGSFFVHISLNCNYFFFRIRSKQFHALIAAYVTNKNNKNLFLNLKHRIKSVD